MLRYAVSELGRTIVMVTHDPIAAAYADAVVFLADGRIVDSLYRADASAVANRMARLGEANPPGRPPIDDELRGLLIRLVG